MATPVPHVAGLVDAHCHLDYAPMSDEAGDVTATLEQARQAGVSQFVHVGCSVDRFAR